MGNINQNQVCFLLLNSTCNRKGQGLFHKRDFPELGLL